MIGWKEALKGLRAVGGEESGGLAMVRMSVRETYSGYVHDGRVGVLDHGGCAEGGGYFEVV